MNKKVYALFLCLLFLGGCAISPKDPWPIGSGGFDRGLGSPAANLGKAQVEAGHWRRQVEMGYCFERESGRAKAYHDIKKGLPLSCQGCSPAMENAYWRVVERKISREYRDWERAEFRRGRSVGLQEIRKIQKKRKRFLRGN